MAHVKEEQMRQWIKEEDIEAIKQWVETTDDIDYIYLYEQELEEEEEEDYDYFYKETWSDPALYHAVKEQKPQIAKYLLDHGANPNFKPMMEIALCI